jgi:SPP1 family predicted phage head-tail adaptor
MLNAAALRTLIAVEQRTPGAHDAAGQPIDTWQPVAGSPLWADVRHLSGKEAVAAGIEASTVAASIRVRYRTDIAAGMRVRIGASLYNIQAVLPDLARREYLDLPCTLGGNDG